MRLLIIPILAALFFLTGCQTTELAPVLRPVAHELPLAQINHQTGIADRLEIAIWRDGTVLRQYDNNRYIVSHAMPATLRQLKRRIAELDFDKLPEREHAVKPPVSTLFVAGRRQATRPVAIFSQHHALASSHEFDAADNADNTLTKDPFELLWNAVRENVEITAGHSMNPEFVPANFNTRRIWKPSPSGESVAVLEIYGDKIDNKPTYISVSHHHLFPEK